MRREAPVPKVELDVETTVPPEQVRAALLDFSPRRPDVWPSIEPTLYEVIEVADTHAVVREGSRMPGGNMWARERYDWSDPQVVTWTVQESNFCTPGSYVSAAIAAAPDGGSRVHIVWNRTPTSIAGRIAASVIRLTGGKPVAGSFRRGMARLERTSGA